MAANNIASSLLKAPEDTSVRLNVVLSGDVAQALQEISDATDVTKTALIRDAIALLKLAHDQKKKGRYLGFATDEGKLDTVVVGARY